jgi:sec-independent protein translocase protein TatB
MFDFAWTEIALIGIVALIAIGPKDMPVAIRAVSGAIKKARKMAGEFQTHVDEMVREANLDEVRTQFSELRSFNIRDQVAKHVDPDGALRTTLSSNPLAPAKAPTSTGPLADQVGAAAASEASAIGVIERTPAAKPVLDTPAGLDPRLFGRDAAVRAAEAPAFIPPNLAAPPPRPAFIPPGAAPPGA